MFIYKQTRSENRTGIETETCIVFYYFLNTRLYSKFFYLSLTETVTKLLLFYSFRTEIRTETLFHLNLSL